MSNHDGKPNQLLVDHGDWQEWDIGTNMYPDAVLKINTEDMQNFRKVCSGKIFAFMGRSTLYAYFYENGTKLRILHRVILSAPKCAFVDHINHDGLDNRRSNLRLATSSENNSNRVKQKNNTSGTPGVLWNKQKNSWQALIKKQRKVKHLGFFKNLEEAVAARKKAEICYFGAFAYHENLKVRL